MYTYQTPDCKLVLTSIRSLKDIPSTYRGDVCAQFEDVYDEWNVDERDYDTYYALFDKPVQAGSMSDSVSVLITAYNNFGYGMRRFLHVYGWRVDEDLQEKQSKDVAL